MPDNSVTLIQRLCEAEGASRELDAEIAWHIGWDATGSVGQKWRDHYESHKVDDDVSRAADNYGVPKFSSSIDVALTLVPEGCWWIIAKGKVRPEEPFYGAQVRTGIMNGDEIIGEGEHDAAPALALCIAALKGKSNFQKVQIPNSSRTTKEG